MVWVGGVALSTIETPPRRTPLACGVKVIVIEHPVPGPKALGQRLASVKFPESPVRLMLLIDKFAVPVLLSRTTCGALFCPTGVVGKEIRVRESVAIGVTPVPVT